MRHGGGAEPELGARPLGDGGCRFRVWAPGRERVEVHLLEPRERLVPLARGERGYHEARVEGVGAGALYRYRLDGGRELPDPASRHQPRGVHGPSAVVDPGAFRWSDGGFRGVSRRRLVFYELHVGTFTREGTLDGAIGRLDALVELGVTAVQLMPLAQFPGERNWGYDGVYPFAVAACYGGPEALRRFVDAAHARGLEVAVDVVYNHLGPEGNYLGEFGPYFSRRYKTPWGDAVNFDGPGSDEVRRYFIENALHWVREHHVDALRLDAVHGICDFSAEPFLRELATAVHRAARERRRPARVIAESDLNDSRLLRPHAQGGFRLDGQWCDDFHHALHALLTGEQQGYYRDFGRPEDLARVLEESYAYGGRYSAYRDRRHGNPAGDLPPRQFVAATQTHDQVGNRAGGERLSALVGFEALKLAAGALLAAPFVPLLFMGEEYGETAPFLYFVSHSDPELVEAVRRGRRAEFRSFGWVGEVPDPQAEATFEASRLQPELAEKGEHAVLRAWYRELLRLRREHPALRGRQGDLRSAGAVEGQRVVWLVRGEDRAVLVLLSFEKRPARCVLRGWPDGRWRVLLDSASRRWRGPGRGPGEGATVAVGAEVDLAPESFVILERGA